MRAIFFGEIDKKKGNVYIRSARCSSVTLTLHMPEVY